MHILYAIKDGKLTHIDNVNNGLNSNCFCSACGEKLVAKNGGEKKVHHFAHYFGSECEHGYETSIHLLAKEILIENKSLQSPELTLEYNYSSYRLKLLQANRISFDNVDSEINFKEIIPDLVCYTESRILMFIEIKVTHGIDEEKYSKLKAYNIPTLEIDLSSVDREIDKNTLSEIILNESNYKKWIYHSLVSEYDEKLGAIAKPKITTKRGLAEHYDFCPINARVYKGKPYANVIDDCVNCEHFVDWSEKGIRCLGKYKAKTRSDIDNLYNEYLKFPDRFDHNTYQNDFLRKIPQAKETRVTEKITNLSNNIETYNLAELWKLNDNQPFRAINVVSQVIVYINKDPKSQWIQYNDRCYGYLQQNGRSYGSKEVFKSQARVWRFKT